MATNDDGNSVDSFEHVPNKKLTEVDDGDSSVDTLDRILDGPSEEPLHEPPRPDVVHMDARFVQDSVHARNVQDRDESPLPSHAEIRDNAVEMLARADKQEQERSLANMDLETQCFHNQVQSLKASRLATPDKRRHIIPKTPASARHVSREVSSTKTPSQLHPPSRIQTPGTGRSLRDRMERSNQKRHDIAMEHSDKKFDQMAATAEKQHKNTQQVINRNVRSEHCKTRRDNKEEIKQMKHEILSELAEQSRLQRQLLAEYARSNCPVESINYRSTATTAASSSSSRKPRRVKTVEQKRWK